MSKKLKYKGINNSIMYKEKILKEYIEERGEGSFAVQLLLNKIYSSFGGELKKIDTLQLKENFQYADETVYAAIELLLKCRDFKPLKDRNGKLIPTAWFATLQGFLDKGKIQLEHIFTDKDMDSIFDYLERFFDDIRVNIDDSAYTITPQFFYDKMTGRVFEQLIGLYKITEGDARFLAKCSEIIILECVDFVGDISYFVILPLEDCDWTSIELPSVLCDFKSTAV